MESDGLGTGCIAFRGVENNSSRPSRPSVQHLRLLNVNRGMDTYVLRVERRAWSNGLGRRLPCLSSVREQLTPSRQNLCGFYTAVSQDWSTLIFPQATFVIACTEGMWYCSPVEVVLFPERPGTAEGTERFA